MFGLKGAFYYLVAIQISIIKFYKKIYFSTDYYYKSLQSKIPTQVYFNPNPFLLSIVSPFKKKLFEMNEINFNEIDLNISLNENNFFKITFPDSKKPSYLYLGNAPSKTETFDYMIILDHSLSIEKIKILAYRESWGGEISSNRWLKQFNGAQAGKKYIYRENISAISGATISVKSMTRSINYFLSDLDKLNSINFFN